MRKYKKSFLQSAVDNKQSEMSRFWLRKTRQPVLAVLAVQKPNDVKPTYYRGINVEVSMPTGSLCAERNAIGTALAADPSIRREHFKMVAVLFMGELSEDHNNTSIVTPQSSSFGLSGLSSLRNMNRNKSFFQEDTDDVNPRGPCGPCMEWLGKIAQCNPSFKIITFSSRDIKEVIV